MHSSLVRLQNVFGLFTTVAFFVALFTALSVLVTPQSPSAELALKSVQVARGRPHYNSAKKYEYAHIRFDLDAGKTSPSLLARATQPLVCSTLGQLHAPHASPSIRSDPFQATNLPCRATDLTSLFSYNTKQLFVYVLATWPAPGAPSAPPHQAVIWDLIIPTPASPYAWSSLFPAASRTKPDRKKAAQAPAGILSLKNQKAKYQITDVSGTMAERGNVTLRLAWNVQPWVGALVWDLDATRGLWEGVRGGRSAAFDLPAIKGAKKAAEGSIR